MPGVRTHLEPAAAAQAQERTASDEAELLERSLQTEFEEDVARIFDESLYSDLELVCGRSKIKTHTCILKARTDKFYQKLDNILHVDINQNTYDEIYSFISDAYTECNIRHQEKEIIEYLKDNLDRSPKEAKLPVNPCKIAKHLNARAAAGVARREPDLEPEVFLTPRCASPGAAGADTRRSISSSPSIELTKEYYALVPIDTHILDKELKEQDALSNAFQSIIKTQPSDFHKSPNRNKPTSLSIRSSHSSKNPNHSSNNIDIAKKSKLNSNTRISKGSDKKLIPTREKSQNIDKGEVSTAATEVVGQSSRADAAAGEAEISPDSLASAADEPSSSSDYLSAATFSPGASSAGCPSLINAESVVKMDQAFTSSDSGLESAHLLESLNGQIDLTVTDLSLTESTLHDLTVDEPSHALSPPPGAPLDAAPEAAPPAGSRSLAQSGPSGALPGERAGTAIAPKHVSKSSKEEKQRLNEEILILESSSLSSETGSWEPVFPIKQTDKELCASFLKNERKPENPEKATHRPLPLNDDSVGEAQQSPFKSKFCFIDASSLVDDDEDRNKIQADNKASQSAQDPVLPTPSKPVPCSASKHDASPSDWSEGHEHDDSLEQADTKDPDSLQKDLSPTIFDMTPITEDSLSTNPFEAAARVAHEPPAHTLPPAAPAHANMGPNQTNNGREDYFPEHVLVSSTPHNSIMSVRPTAKQADLEYCDSNSGSFNHVAHQEIKPSSLKKLPKFTEFSPIVSGGASVEDHLPQVNSFIGSPLTRRKLENAPIVSGAYIPDEDPAKHVRKSPKALCAPAWVVDMSDTESKASTESLSSAHHKRPGDRACEHLRSESKHSNDNISKSRSSLDSDSSERSSHKFYIDLASLPDPAPAPPDTTSKSVIEKKNMFSMYIDLGENTALKEMPARLSSSLNAKKITDIKFDKTSIKSSSNARSENPNKSMTVFERYEALCSNPDISIREIISMPTPKPDPTLEVAQDPNAEKSEQCGLANKVIEKASRLSSSDLFVRLSDLDKPSPKKMLDTTLTIYEHKVSDIRMTRSIPDSGWAGRADVISSFHSENAASLNRLFPHLQTEFSRSMPGSLARARSPPAAHADHPSDMSEISSVQSSYCRSVVENSTTEDSHSQTSSLIGNCQSKLGQDLLRMFLEEIAPDVVVEVSGKRFKAHKCILSSRCQYFAGILSGGWVESAGNVIILPPFSYNVVHFALCHIYSGLSTIPDSVSILELATIADMLGLEGLKEAIMFTLKAKYCHHFHKPCSVCTAGVLECFPLSSVYGLDDLYRKCLRWITKHFHKVWPTKAFATLPKELLDKCYQQHIINMSMDNVIDTICACGITEASLSNARWAEVVGGMCRRLLNAAAQFAAARLSGCVRAAGALPPDLPPPAAAALDAALAAALDWAEPHETCRTYALLSYLVKELKSQHTAKPDLVTHGDVLKLTAKSNYLWARAGEWRARCERSIVKAAPRAVDTPAFRELPPELRARLRDLGCIAYAAPAPATGLTGPTGPHRNNLNKRSSSSRIDIDHVRALFVPYAAKPNLQTLSNDLKPFARKASSHAPKIRTTKAQEERAKFNMMHSNASNSTKNLSKPNKFDKTKPRYLEPRPEKRAAGPGAGARLAVKMVSSSESSRNTSPVLVRGTRRAAGAGAGLGGSAVGGVARAGSGGSRPRTAEPSTDSLSESQNSNKYATYTKSKNPKGSLESTKSSSQQTIPSGAASKSSTKTKIPVYLNHTKSNNLPRRQQLNGGDAGPSTKSNSSNLQTKQRGGVSGSLMMATQSSSAKIVARSKEPPAAARQSKGKTRAPAAPEPRPDRPDRPDRPEIPLMERSGTFLKDEPTFGDKTTNIDIAQ